MTGLMSFSQSVGQFDSQSARSNAADDVTKIAGSRSSGDRDLEALPEQKGAAREACLVQELWVRNRQTTVLSPRRKLWGYFGTLSQAPTRASTT